MRNSHNAITISAALFRSFGLVGLVGSAPFVDLVSLLDVGGFTCLVGLVGLIALRNGSFGSDLTSLPPELNSGLTSFLTLGLASAIWPKVAVGSRSSSDACFVSLF